MSERLPHDERSSRDEAPRDQPLGAEPPRKVYVETYGCQMNVYDTRALLDELRRSNYEQVEQPDEADLMLLNTCAVRDNAENRVLGRIGQLQPHRKRRDDAVLGVIGCMAQRLGPELQERRRVVDLVVGTDGYGRLPGLVDAIRADGRPRSDVEADGVTTYVASPETDPTNNTHFISITRGCDYRCTFCVVPSTRGILRAKAPRQVLDEVRAVVEGGGVEVTLLGQNVTAYRHPEATFAELIREVAAVAGLRRIRFLTSHPTDFPEETLHAIAECPPISPWLHMPLQSGNDRVLRRMKRGYKVADYMAVVDRARELLPDVTFSTDIIVGFPGETEEQFQDTLRLMREVPYDSAFTFKYSPRPGTPADRLEDDVAEDVKSDRLTRLIELQASLWAERASALVGETWRVALEGPDVKGRGFWKGRTLNNRKVLVPFDENLLKGDELMVRVNGVEKTTFFADPVDVVWKVPRVAA